MLHTSYQTQAIQMETKPNQMRHSLSFIAVLIYAEHSMTLMTLTLRASVLLATTFASLALTAPARVSQGKGLRRIHEVHKQTTELFAYLGPNYRGPSAGGTTVMSCSKAGHTHTH